MKVIKLDTALRSVFNFYFLAWILPPAIIKGMSPHWTKEFQQIMSFQVSAICFIVQTWCKSEKSFVCAFDFKTIYPASMFFCKTFNLQWILYSDKLVIETPAFEEVKYSGKLNEASVKFTITNFLETWALQQLQEWALVKVKTAIRHVGFKFHLWYF